jgi:hypothetical protein
VTVNHRVAGSIPARGAIFPTITSLTITSIIPKMFPEVRASFFGCSVSC